MADLIYPWKRFWYRRGTSPNLGDDGFLEDPESAKASAEADGAASFESISHTPCIVLLGEPGMGKSTALKAEFDGVQQKLSGSTDEAIWCDLRDFPSGDNLDRKVFRGEVVTRWLGSDNTLHLFLDSLDEGLININSLAAFLLAAFKELPSQRLHLRIASRPADWPPTLEDGITQLWGEKSTGVFELAPLRRADAKIAAKTAGITDADSFMEQVLDRDVVAFAFKPVTLDFLISTYKKNKALSKNRAQLYLEGCRRLCEERNQNRKDALLSREKLSVGQRLSIATRFAAVTQFANKSAVSTSLEQDLRDGDVSLDAIIGDTEGKGTATAPVDLKALREVLDTGLFSSRGRSRQGWRHQTYAEFLAAQYVVTRNLPIERIRSLLLHPDGSGNVIPQLRETAVWMAELRRDVFQLVVKNDPVTLLRSASALSSPADRSAITRNLLKSFEADTIRQDFWTLRPDFQALNNPDIAGIAEPYLKDPSRRTEARLAAVDIARACRILTLLPCLEAIALNPDEDLRLRTHSAATIVAVGDKASKAAIRPLAFGPAADDPQQELLGYGLLANWPSTLTATELFAALKPVQDERYYGSYKRFFDSGIVQHLKLGDIVTALKWARQYPEDHRHIEMLPRLATKILERAVQHIHQPIVLDLLAQILLERMQKYTDCSSITENLRLVGDAARQSTASALFRFAASDKHGAGIVMDLCAITQRDVSWLLTELSLATATDVRRLIAQVISRRLGYDDVDAFDDVWSAMPNCPELQQEMDPLVRAVTLGSPEAGLMREQYDRSQAYQNATPDVPVPIAESLTAILADYRPNLFCDIYYLLRSNPRKRDADTVEPVPGWITFDHDTKSQILRAAREYLTTRPAGRGGFWGLGGTYSVAMLAGYDALYLMGFDAPDSVEQLSQGDWEFWTPILINQTSESGDGKLRSSLLKNAYTRAPDVFHTVVSQMIDDEDARYGRVFVIQHIGDIWSDELAKVLRLKITDGALKPESFRSVLARLLASDDAVAKGLARQTATSPVSAVEDERLRAIAVTAELLAYHPQDWAMIWPYLQADEAFGIAVFERVAYEHEFSSFAMKLGGNDIADICIWLAERGLERKSDENNGLVTPRVALANWWNYLVSFLGSIGTADARDGARRLVAALPQYPGLRRTLKSAEELARRSTWTPLTPEEVIGLTAPSSRMVISLHGIRSRGEWQKQMNLDLQADGFLHEPLDYGRFWAVQLLFSSQRAKKIEWFCSQYERLTQARDILPSVIAHSFGTYIVTAAMEKYPELRFDRIILCGAIVRTDYDWDALIAAGRVNAVLNQYGGEDLSVRLGAYCVTGAGRSGVDGFDSSNPQLFQELRKRFRHSDYFYSLNYRESWIPFLRGFDPD